MNSVVKRVLLTFTAVPALFSLIFFFPMYNHLPFAILVVLAVIAGSIEMGRIIFSASVKEYLHIVILSSFIPVFTYIDVAFFSQYNILTLYLMTLITMCMAREIYRGSIDSFTSSIEHVGLSLLLILYPGGLSIFLIKILFLPYPTELTLLLFLLVFGNDTFAYVFGMLFGKGNRNIIKVSPNKSIAGFIGGLLMTFLIAILFRQFVPHMSSFFTILQVTILAIIIGIIANIGDLVESTFKRSAKVKDSGTIILGRGGIMDSIDSLILSAPFFTLLISLYIV